MSKSPSLNALADSLSKQTDVDDWTITPGVWSVVCKHFGQLDCDRFASDSVHLLPQFCSKFWSPSVWYVDCFSTKTLDESRCVAAMSSSCLGFCNAMLHQLAF